MTKELGAIACGHEAAARAGAEALVDGGNAIDAAVAAVFASCTAEPTLTGLGGAGFITVHLADGTDAALDFFASTPGIDRVIDAPLGPVPVEVMFGTTQQIFRVGPESCAVPGFVKGVLTAHERWGRLPLARVLETGIDLARNGIVMTERQAYCHQILDGIVMRTATGRELFGRPGAPRHGDAAQWMLGEGDRFAQPDLADTFETLARDGAAAFYTGDIAREIVRWSDENNGLISAQDLARYELREVTPVRSRFRSLEYRSVPRASSGGALVAYALRLMDACGAGKIDVDSADGADLLVRILEAANATRGAEFDRYLYGGGLVDWLLGQDSVDRGVAAVHARDVGEQHRSSKLGSTTHLSVIDAEGNAVSMTTSTGCGAGEFVGRTGIHLNNMLGEEDLLPVEHELLPGDRLTSMMSPLLLLEDARPVLASGSAGSSRIRSAIAQTLLRIVDSGGGGAELQERVRAAVDAPRLHAEAGIVHAEPGFAPEVLDALDANGHSVTRWDEQNMFFGGVNMVAVGNDGHFAAAADRRRGGGAFVAHADGSLTAG